LKRDRYFWSNIQGTRPPPAPAEENPSPTAPAAAKEEKEKKQEEQAAGVEAAAKEEATEKEEKKPLATAEAAAKEEKEKKQEEQAAGVEAAAKEEATEKEEKKPLATAEAAAKEEKEKKQEEQAAGVEAAAKEEAAEKEEKKPLATAEAAAKEEKEKKQEAKMPTADEIERTKKKLSREIKRIGLLTRNLVDNGLFDEQKKAFEEKGIDPDKTFEDIQEYLNEARTKLYDDDLSGSELFTSKARRCYNKALYTPSRWWRFSNVYAVPIWIYLVGFLAAVLAFYIIQLDYNFLHLNPPGVRIQEDALHAATWGTVGGILRGLWFLKNKVSTRKYENSFRIYFLSVPFLGGLFGALIYFILIAGVFILAPTQTPTILNQTAPAPNATQTGPVTQVNTTSTTTTTNSTTTTNRTQGSAPPTTTTTTTTNRTQGSAPPTGNVPTLAIIPLAALAGYNWEWAVTIFNRIGDSFKERREEDREEEEREE
jgi:chemotaxis protein histidine kinase CheA